MTITRINSIGLEYQLTADGRTTIAVVNPRTSHAKTVTLDMPLADVDQCWYDWQTKGYFIQIAFAGLPAEQREFLVSGITPTEWEKMFREEER